MVSSVIVLEVSDNPTGKSKKRKRTKYKNWKQRQNNNNKKKHTRTSLVIGWLRLSSPHGLTRRTVQCRGHWFSPRMSHLMAKRSKEKLYLLTNNVIVWGWLTSPGEKPPAHSQWSCTHALASPNSHSSPTHLTFSSLNISLLLILHFARHYPCSCTNAPQSFQVAISLWNFSQLPKEKTWPLLQCSHTSLVTEKSCCVACVCLSISPCSLWTPEDPVSIWIIFLPSTHCNIEGLSRC